MNKQLTQFIEKSSQAVAEKALQLILTTAQQAIEKNGRFVLSLAGGNTPKMLYKLLARTEQEWHKWFLIYGDERCLAPFNPERNSFIVESLWLEKVNFPEQNHYSIDISSNIEQSANEYSHAIAYLLPIDLAILGVGEDGHTASLFSQNCEKDFQNQKIAFAVHNSPKPPKERVSLSYTTFNQAKTVCFLATGDTKRGILEQFESNQNLPINRIKGAENTFFIRD